MSRTYTITLEFEVEMTSKGSPARGPSFSSGGEPAEPSEFEIETISFEGAGQATFEYQYKEYKDKMPKGVPVESFDQFVANKLYDKVHELAAEDDWSDLDDDYDPPDHD